jgi:sugar fermentation stimulation protein A
MSGLAVSGARAWVQDSGNPKRKLRYSLELIETSQGAQVCVNTARANRLVAEALELGVISELAGHSHRAEMKWRGQDLSTGESLEARFDFALGAPEVKNLSHPSTGYLEVKSVTYAPDPVQRPGVVAFPDSVTARGLKHLKALSAVAASGERAVLLFCVNRDDAREVTIAEEIDPAYAQGMREAIKSGVEVLAYRADATQQDHKMTQRLVFVFA